MIQIAERDIAGNSIKYFTIRKYNIKGLNETMLDNYNVVINDREFNDLCDREEFNKALAWELLNEVPSD